MPVYGYSLMIFGGLQKNSLIDYPEKISCVLFISGCNFDCPYCHNPELAKGTLPVRIQEDDVYNFLEKRKGFLDGVVLSGGEPTLCKDLFSLCERIKQIGYPVKLDTNGSKPRIVQQLIDESLIDYIAMDIKTDPLHYAPLIQKKASPDPILSSIRIIMKSTIPYEFRTTCLKPFVDENIIERIAQLIKGAMLYVLQKFHDTDVLHPEFFQENWYGFDDDELVYLKSIAEPWVKKCVVR